MNRLAGGTTINHFRQRLRSHLTVRLYSSETNDTLYLHVGPGGDCWTGSSIFAAKHLQPDYVQSIEIPCHMDSAALLSLLEEDPSTAQQIYDTKEFPSDMAERLRVYQKEQERTK